MGYNSLKTRHRQQTQQKRRQEKAVRREQGKQEKPVLPHSADGIDPDLQGMVPGPQRPRDDNE